MLGVTLGGYHSINDLGLVLQTVNVPLPVPKTSIVDVPGADGVIDLTEAFGSVKMQNRIITMTFTDRDHYRYRYSNGSRVANMLHGKKVQIIFDEDPYYYYYGRLTFGEFLPNGSTRELTITADCEPYKYDIHETDEDWLWDPFNFLIGVIRDYGDIAVNGSETVTVIGGQQNTIPVITVDAAMTVTFNGSTYNLAVGANKNYNIILEPGENELTFTGTGTVSIKFRGTSL